MTNVKWKNINDMDDIRAKRTYEEAVGQGKDPDEVLAYFSELGRDNARKTHDADAPCAHKPGQCKNADAVG